MSKRRFLFLPSDGLSGGLQPLSLILTLFFMGQVLTACSQTQIQDKAPDTHTDAGMSIAPMSGGLDTNWTEPVTKSNAEWKKILTPEQYHIMREQGTERPFTSELLEVHDEGVFVCLGCNNPLFGSETKFNSGTGWPSYYAPYSSKSVHVSTDNSLGMTRDEVSCKRCGAHLGHVFDDGPKPTGLRYCIDGVAMKFVKASAGPHLSIATFASGCFWCEENVFENVIGVGDVISGYSGGKEKNPTYEEVGSGRTGHAESIEFAYDSSVISFPSLLKVFFASQDPTQVNGQGPDHGSQYRSIIFYRNEAEKRMAENYISELNASGKYKKPIATEVLPYTKFWPAEGYHQDYIKHHPTDNPYVLNESIPRFNRTKSRVPEFFKK